MIPGSSSVQEVKCIHTTRYTLFSPTLLFPGGATIWHLPCIDWLPKLNIPDPLLHLYPDLSEDCAFHFLPHLRLLCVCYLSSVLNPCVHANTCPPTSTCINGPGRVICNCSAGFRYNASTQTCDDIDECANGVCTQFATCTNSLGSYNCSCNQHYEGSGKFFLRKKANYLVCTSML